jgi:hypothetical protein
MPTSCACVSFDPFDCARVRYKLWQCSADEIEPCECVCHDDQYDDADDGVSVGVGE